MSIDTIRTVRAMTREIRGRVRGLIRRSTLGTLNVAGQLQTMQAKTTADDVDDDVELFEPYGFTSGPPAGSEGLVLRVGGERGHSVALAFGKRSTRPSGVLQGEVSVYHESGAHVTLRTDGSIEVYPANGQAVKLGGEGGLPVARQTDPVGPSVDMAAWMAAVNTALVAVPSTALTVPPPASLGSVTTGGMGSEST